MLVRALFLGAVAIDVERVVMDGKAMFSCNFFLACFNGSIIKLFQMAALQTNDMIMVLTMI